jgi:hypothetical protein
MIGTPHLASPPHCDKGSNNARTHTSARCTHSTCTSTTRSDPPGASTGAWTRGVKPHRCVGAPPVPPRRAHLRLCSPGGRRKPSTKARGVPKLNGHQLLHNPVADDVGPAPGAQGRPPHLRLDGGATGHGAGAREFGAGRGGGLCVCQVHLYIGAHISKERRPAPAAETLGTRPLGGGRTAR